MNNERSWYALHKGECAQYLTGPMNELAREVHDMFSEKYPRLDLNVHMSRIYRDARRNYGKGPYKDYLWFTLYDAKYEHWSNVPSYWFEIGADYWSYGVGCWEDRAAFMRKLRARIVSSPETVRELNRLLDSQTEFELGGEYYKKQYTDCPYPDLDPWYRKKNISVSHEEPVGPAILGKEFGDRIKEGMLFLTPFYEFICAVRSDPDPESPEEA